MMPTMIFVEPDVMQGLLGARQHSDENWSDIIRRFLNNGSKASAGFSTLAELPVSKPAASVVQKVRYQILGEHRTAENAGAAMIDILVTLAHLEPSLPDRLAPMIQGTSRNHLARSAEQVYPRRPDLAHFVINILPGWYIGTNIANREKTKILRAACAVTGLTFSIDLSVDFADKH
jgi:hypothetical protein